MLDHRLYGHLRTLEDQIKLNTRAIEGQTEAIQAQAEATDKLARILGNIPADFFKGTK